MMDLFVMVLLGTLGGHGVRTLVRMLVPAVRRWLTLSARAATIRAASRMPRGTEVSGRDSQGAWRAIRSGNR
ncbi:hypothetical protein GCM10007977_025160 [Dactylosporangium sucinum]|uniref:Uncharacterized protein n=1 Tax=Dactylosporangium sucinum TaxID=1424081 RepID=A0A917TH37_9ACTN|nr:hypothetical protein GCM10007977_025160 [Dactylosporangium sucinum]